MNSIINMICITRERKYVYGNFLHYDFFNYHFFIMIFSLSKRKRIYNEETDEDSVKCGESLHMYQLIKLFLNFFFKVQIQYISCTTTPMCVRLFSIGFSLSLFRPPAEKKMESGNSVFYHYCSECAPPH